MPTDFKPLRRKIGVLTLMVACVLAAVWILNLAGYPESFPRLFRIEFVDAGIRVKVSRVHAPRSVVRVEGNTTIISGPAVSATQMLDTLIPYWSIVTPPTLLSAYLLLSKPRAGKITDVQSPTISN